MANEQVAVEKSSFQIGAVFGIRVLVHWSFLLPLLVVTLLAVSERQLAKRLLDLALFVAVLVSLFAHEMGHAATAWRYGVRTTILVFHGMGAAVLFDRELRGRPEIAVTLAGPLANFAVALVLVLPVAAWSGLVVPSRYDLYAPSTIAELLRSILWLNIWLGVLNLIPCFPLDGGRILRGVFYLLTNDSPRSTRLAARLGIAGAVALGLLSFAFYEWVNFTSVAVFIGMNAFHVLRQQHASDGAGDATLPPDTQGRSCVEQVMVARREVGRLHNDGVLKRDEAVTLSALLSGAIGTADRTDHDKAARYLNAFADQVCAYQQAGTLSGIQAQLLMAALPDRVIDIG